MNASKDLTAFFSSEPPGEKTNAIRWLQKKVMAEALKLPREFKSRGEWEAFRTRIRKELPSAIGIPSFPPLRESTTRARIRVTDRGIGIAGDAQARVFEMGVFGGVRVVRGATDAAAGAIPVQIQVQEAPFRSVSVGPGVAFQQNRCVLVANLQYERIVVAEFWPGYPVAGR